MPVARLPYESAGLMQSWSTRQVVFGLLVETSQDNLFIKGSRVQFCLITRWWNAGT